MDNFTGLSIGGCVVAALVLTGTVQGRDEYTDDGWFFRNYMNISEVPDDIPAEAKGVYINSNIISRLSSGTFSHLTSCTFLSLSWNFISEIEPGSFQGLNSIDDLSLFMNKLTILKSGMFSGLDALDNLVLSNNMIEAIDDGAFIGLKNLKKLYLYGNNLTHLRVKMFNGLDSLDELTLSFNNIITMERGAFDGLPNVEELWLDNNVIQGIIFEQFMGLTGLKLLHMTINNASTIADGAFKDQSGLEKIWIDTCGIRELRMKMFKGLSSIELINLDGNFLTEIKDGIFNDLKTLKELDFENNTITVVHPDAFKGLDQLTTVWLNENHITTLEAAMFTPLPRPLTFSLNDNPLQCDRRLCWLKQGEREGWVRWNTDRRNGDVLKPDCSNGADWDSVILNCPQEVQCPDPGGVAHATRSGAPWPFIPGTNITYTCNTCYKGGGRISCQENGNWTRKPTCQVLTCRDPGGIKYGRKVPQRSTYRCGDHVTYICNHGYRMRGTATLKCEAHGKFQGPLPKCVKYLTPETAASTAEHKDSTVDKKWIYGAVVGVLLIVIVIALVIILFKRRGYHLCYRQGQRERLDDTAPASGAVGASAMGCADAEGGLSFVNKAAMFDDDDMKHEKLRHSSEGDTSMMSAAAGGCTSMTSSTGESPVEPPPEYSRHPSIAENQA